MMTQTLSLLLSVEKGLPERKVIEWIEGSLQEVIEYQSSRMPILSGHETREAIYARVAISACNGFCENAMMVHLANPPKAIQLIDLRVNLLNSSIILDRLYIKHLWN